MKYINIELQEVPLKEVEERINNERYPLRAILIDITNAIGENERDPYIDQDYKDRVHQVLFAKLSQVIQSLEN